MYASDTRTWERTDDFRRRRLAERSEPTGPNELDRGFDAAPWARPGAEVDTRAFMCECGDRSGEAVIELLVTRFPSEPLFADGHG